jgi:hypothetical protein
MMITSKGVIIIAGPFEECVLTSDPDTTLLKSCRAGQRELKLDSQSCPSLCLGWELH